MIKNNLEALGRIALYRGAEEAVNQPSNRAGASFPLDPGSWIQSSAEVETDAGSITGSEFPTRLFSAARGALGSLAQSRARPDFIAFVLAYFLGEVQTAAVGATAFEHVIGPAPGLELPSFTAVQRRGAGIFTERLSGNFIESFTIGLGEGWVTASAEVIGTGARETDYEREVIEAPADSASITLASNKVAGATALERLGNLYRVRAKDAGSQAWTTLEVASVSDGEPAVITFVQPLGSSSSDVQFHLDYLVPAPDWAAFPAEAAESPLKLIDSRVIADAYFDGTTLLGGQTISSGIESISVSGKNNLELKRFPGDSGPAALALRGAREITISLSEGLRNTVGRWRADNPETETLALALLLEGAQIDEGGERFGAELIFPRCGLVKSAIVSGGGRLSEEGDLVVMDDGVCGGAIIRCHNRVDGYL